MTTDLYVRMTKWEMYSGLMTSLDNINMLYSNTNNEFTDL